MRILYVTTIGGTMNFFKEFIKELVISGHEVDIACNDSVSKVSEFFGELGCKVYSIATSRSPLNKDNIIAIKQIRELVQNKKYNIVHCHTPIAAMCTRLACRKVRKQGTRVFYTAHGFHFYKGAPLKNWLMYYPMEKICSYWTDVLITINTEDYALAKKKMKAKKVEYVPGVGIDLQKFNEVLVDKEAKRQEFGIPKDAILLLSVGELNENKNHQIIIRAMAELMNLKYHYIIAGKGGKLEELKKLAEELDLSNNIHLLGFRNDINELCKIADIFCFPSYREGLGLAAIEAMACGLPLVTSNVHGINDYSEDNVTGYKCSPNDVESFSRNIKRLAESSMLRMKIKENNCRLAHKYDVKDIICIMKDLYELN